MSAVKNPLLVEAGRRGALKRWGEPRVVRLDALTSEQRAVVLALVDAATKKDATADHGDAQEVRHAGATTTS